MPPFGIFKNWATKLHKNNPTDERKQGIQKPSVYKWIALKLNELFIFKFKIIFKN